jgi:hypothetical protein
MADSMKDEQIELLPGALSISEFSGETTLFHEKDGLDAMNFDALYDACLLEEVFVDRIETPQKAIAEDESPSAEGQMGHSVKLDYFNPVDECQTEGTLTLNIQKTASTEVDTCEQHGFTHDHFNHMIL